MRRRRVALGALLAGTFAGLAFAHRTRRRRGQRVELFYEDGSFVTLVDDEARPLVDIARSALDAARA